MNNMKKLTKFALCFSAVLLFLTSCTSNQPMPVNTASPETTATATAVPSEKPVQNSEVKIYACDSVNTEFTTLSEYSYDMDNDGVDEEIVLTINAQRNSDGSLDLNDGQNWQLYVQKGEKYYLLIDRYVQIGKINFNVADYYNEDKTIPTIVATTDTNAKLVLNAYTFNLEENCFVERVLYDSSTESDSGINKMYSSDPEVE